MSNLLTLLFLALCAFKIEARLYASCSSDADCDSDECCTRHSFARGQGQCWFGARNKIKEGSRCSPIRTDRLPSYCPAKCGTGLKCEYVSDARYGVFRRVSVCVKDLGVTAGGSACKAHTECSEDECCMIEKLGQTTGVCSHHSGKYLGKAVRCRTDARENTKLGQCPVECRTGLKCVKPEGTTPRSVWIVYGQYSTCQEVPTEGSGSGDMGF